MHLLFLDESIARGAQVLRARRCPLRDADWHTLRDLWQGTIAEHRSPPEREVIWHGITGEVPPALADGVVATPARAPLTCYVTLLEVELGLEEAPEFFASEEETYAIGLMFLAERFQHLLSAEDDVGLIVVDSRFREEDSRLRRFVSDPHEGWDADSQLGRLVEGLFLGPSHSLDRPPVRRPRRRDHRRRRARERAGTRLPADALAPLRRITRRGARSRASASSASRSAAAAARTRSSSDQLASAAGSALPAWRRVAPEGTSPAARQRAVM